VRAFDRVDPGNSLPGVEWRTGDVRDVAALRRACEGCEVVFHLASLNPQRKANLETMRAVNVGGTGNILEAARAAGVRRVVYLSSVEIFGAPKWRLARNGGRRRRWASMAVINCCGSTLLPGGGEGIGSDHAAPDDHYRAGDG